MWVYTWECGGATHVPDKHQVDSVQEFYLYHIWIYEVILRVT